MNILILDKSTVIAAQMLCGKHIVKMPLGTAQLLSSVFAIALKTPNPLVSITDQNIEVPYKLTHKNHPCSLWARQSKGNFYWLWKRLCIALFTIIRTYRNTLLAHYRHKYISYHVRTIIRKAIKSTTDDTKELINLKKL
nr:hypothetical protein [Wolbachia endosymbiont of Laodelphax striatellus]